MKQGVVKQYFNSDDYRKEEVVHTQYVDGVGRYDDKLKFNPSVFQYPNSCCLLHKQMEI